MKKTPKISIVTATYNLINSGRSDYIIQNIESVHNQTYKNIQHIIIDGASNDGTLDLLRPYQDKGYIQVISEPDTGIYNAMNKGMKKADGDYIIILNSDDYLNGNVLSSIFESDNFDNPDCIFCGENIIDDKTGNKTKTLLPHYDDYSDLSYLLFSEPLTQGLIIKKSVYKDLGYYNENYRIVSDGDFFIKLLNSGKYSIKTCYCALSCFRFGGLSDSQSPEDMQKHLHERAKMIKSYFPELSQEQSDFASFMQWRTADEIKKFWSKFYESDFSEKFVHALNDLYKLKSGDCKDYLFKETKEIMIQKLDTLPILKENNNEIVVCMASDHGYEAHLYVTIYSLIKQIKTKLKYHIYILDGGIKHKGDFFELSEKNPQIKIDFIDMRNQFKQIFVSRHVSVAAYYRLAIFWIFQNFKRVVYIDADSLLLDDIANLFNMDIKNKLIGASMDSLTWQNSWKNAIIKHGNFNGRYIDYEKNILNHSNEKIKTYFSSGVIVLNFEKTNVAKKRDLLKQLLLKDYYCHDQDILNLLYSESETFDIGRQWNYFNIQNALAADDYLSDTERDNYFGAMSNPKLVSYVLKPWNYDQKNCDFSEQYWKLLRQSPYYDDVMQKMNTNNIKNNIVKNINPSVSEQTNKYKIKYYLFGLPILKTEEK